MIVLLKYLKGEIKVMRFTKNLNKEIALTGYLSHS
jgi:hypothetical protein